jgi:hypothetical protein
MVGMFDVRRSPNTVKRTHDHEVVGAMAVRQWFLFGGLESGLVIALADNT